MGSNSLQRTTVPIKQKSFMTIPSGYQKNLDSESPEKRFLIPSLAFTFEHLPEDKYTVEFIKGQTKIDHQSVEHYVFSCAF